MSFQKLKNYIEMHSYQIENVFQQENTNNYYIMLSHLHRGFSFIVDGSFQSFHHTKHVIQPLDIGNVDVYGIPSTKLLETYHPDRINTLHIGPKYDLYEAKAVSRQLKRFIPLTRQSPYKLSIITRQYFCTSQKTFSLPSDLHFPKRRVLFVVPLSTFYERRDHFADELGLLYTSFFSNIQERSNNVYQLFSEIQKTCESNAQQIHQLAQQQTRLQKYHAKFNSFTLELLKEERSIQTNLSQLKDTSHHSYRKDLHHRQRLNQEEEKLANIQSKIKESTRVQSDIQNTMEHLFSTTDDLSWTIYAILEQLQMLCEVLFRLHQID